MGREADLLVHDFQSPAAHSLSLSFPPIGPNLLDRLPKEVSNAMESVDGAAPSARAVSTSLTLLACS